MRYPSKETIESLRRQYPVGTLVELCFMDDPQSPPVGTRGKVIAVDDIGTVHVAWQTGSSLGAAFGKDSIRKVADSDA